MAKNKRKVTRDQPTAQRRRLLRERLAAETQRADTAERSAQQAWAAAAAAVTLLKKRFRFQDLGFKGFSSRFSIRVYGCLRGGK